ncbi:MAG: MoxR family ATPase [Candidatus Methanosuratus sp.]|nr:MoxR family ATPase [Candidatus Methanosuratincola sp.]
MSAVTKIQQEYNIIGRTEELRQALLAIAAKKHILIEGPVGVGKTVMAMAIANFLKRRIFRVDGDERYTEQKLVGWFDPPLVMSQGYSRKAFIEGPLTQAMTEGAFLFINELNRMPEGTQNVLLPAMDEGRITIPHIGTVEAKEGFLIIATQNPEEYIGTSRLSEALKDRFVWVRLDYQSEEEEVAIVRKEAGSCDDELIQLAVKIVRKTRNSADIRRGASIRGAIDIVAITERMIPKRIAELDEPTIKEAIGTAAIMALPSKIEIMEGSHEKVVEVVRKIVNGALEEYFRLKKVSPELLAPPKNF